MLQNAGESGRGGWSLREVRGRTSSWNRCESAIKGVGSGVKGVTEVVSQGAVRRDQKSYSIGGVGGVRNRPAAMTRQRGWCGQK